MALIKKNEFRQMTEQQLRNRLIEIEKELVKLNGQRAMHTTLESPGRVKLIRKTRARIFTRINELKHQAPQQKQAQKEEAKRSIEKPKEQQHERKSTLTKTNKSSSNKGDRRKEPKT